MLQAKNLDYISHLRRHRARSQNAVSPWGECRRLLFGALEGEAREFGTQATYRFCYQDTCRAYDTPASILCTRQHGGGNPCPREEIGGGRELQVTGQRGGAVRALCSTPAQTVSRGGFSRLLGCMSPWRELLVL